MNVFRLSVVVFVGPLLCGCVTETRPTSNRSTGSNEQHVAMPIGPIASPLPDVTSSARIRVQVTPIGLVRYDGQVLPLLSPDGRFLVVEDGDSPTWETLLAKDGARPAMRTRLQVFEFTDRGMVRVSFTTRVPTGLVLGRSANNKGFLVESPRLDGSRWIGLVRWREGGIDWLVKNDNVNAHAVFTPGGHLVYTSRAIGDSMNALMLRDRSGVFDQLKNDELSYAFPACTDEPGVVYVFADEKRELLLQAIHIAESGVTQGTHVFGAVEAERWIASNPSLVLVYQCLAGVGYGLPERDGREGASRLPFVFVHPVRQRLVAFDRTDGSFSEFPERAHASTHSILKGDEGYFVTLPDGLFYTTMAEIDAKRGAPLRAARVLDDAYIPRASSSPDRPVVLFGPTQGDRFELGILALTVPSPVEP